MTDIEEFDDGYDGSDAPEARLVDHARFRRFMELRVKRDTLKAAYEGAERAYRADEQALFDDLATSGIRGSVKVDLGPPYGEVRFQRRETYYSKIIDQDKLLQYLEQRAMADEATTVTFSKKRLNELVNEALENKTPPPPGLDFSASRGITVTLQK